MLTLDSPCSSLGKLEDIMFVTSTFLAYFLREKLEIPPPTKPLIYGVYTKTQGLNGHLCEKDERNSSEICVAQVSFTKALWWASLYWSKSTGVHITPVREWVLRDLSSLITICGGRDLKRNRIHVYKQQNELTEGFFWRDSTERLRYFPTQNQTEKTFLKSQRVIKNIFC